MEMEGLIVDPRDNVGTVIREVKAGERITLSRGRERIALTPSEDIPIGHKVATSPIAPGEPVIKYGLPIGSATAAIGLGELVHVHNVESKRGRGDLGPGPR